ncbi:hypothetical protein [Rhodobacter sp. 24-YEA-8]|uniref:hypothetical protein n=1 Tax=Rhodobacter sp. 24-YEA-8 TaxID=1884310 RepID=UPI00089C6EAF|nr:hypothetical protein [Rhodobacter sp. 24-YEA-8]SED82867.1 2-aminobenzoate-CoA ligase [Rhodobacter sp. 24-YEA-8]
MPGATAHTDGFTSDDLLTEPGMPVFLPGASIYPEHPDAAVELTGQMVDRGTADRIRRHSLTRAFEASH